MGQIITVDFRGDTLYGFESDDGVFVALKPIVESMGMDWSAQLKRVKRDPILSKGMAIMATPFGRGGDQECVCLRLDRVNGWLFTIDSSRIPDLTVRERVIVYQEECYGVLHKHFYGRNLDERIAGLADKAADVTTDEPVSSRRKLVTEARQTFGNQAGREMWFKMNLPTVPAMFADPKQGEFFTYTAIRRDPAPDGGEGKAA